MDEPTLSRDEVRELDRIAIEELGIPGVVLMENAGRGAAQAIVAFARERLGRSPTRATIVCGGGNNGGDGYVIARHFAIRGIQVQLVSSVDGAALRGDAKVMRTICERMGLSIVTAREPSTEVRASVGELVIDALLGTGFRGELSREALAWVRALEALRTPLKIAVDLPTGLDADTGRPCPEAFHAQLTTTFAAQKQGFDAPGAAAFLGRVVVVPIGTPPSLVDRVREKRGRPGA
ncbi:MAG: NAD(P)H-hydrate epimerase [Planctomycetes bacterium]|nr:NAD(P)H-hydrate epimerase [Planctomycetota bacterium]